MPKRSRAGANKLADLMKQRRQELNLTPTEVARRAGLAHTTIIRLERGEFAHPSPNALEAIGLALNLPVEDIMVEAGWLPHTALPNLKPYLHAKYCLSPEVMREVDSFFDQLGEKHGLDFFTDDAGHGSDAGNPTSHPAA